MCGLKFNCPDPLKAPDKTPKNPIPNLRAESILRDPRYKSQTQPSVPQPSKLLTKQAQPASKTKPAKLPMTPFPTTIPKLLMPQQQLLSWHLRLGHILFNILKQASQEGILPPILQKANNPIWLSIRQTNQDSMAPHQRLRPHSTCLRTRRLCVRGPTCLLFSRILRPQFRQRLQEEIYGGHCIR